MYGKQQSKFCIAPQLSTIHTIKPTNILLRIICWYFLFSFYSVSIWFWFLFGLLLYRLLAFKKTKYLLSQLRYPYRKASTERTNIHSGRNFTRRQKMCKLFLLRKDCRIGTSKWMQTWKTSIITHAG